MSFSWDVAPSTSGPPKSDLYLCLGTDIEVPLLGWGRAHGQTMGEWRVCCPRRLKGLADPFNTLAMSFGTELPMGKQALSF